MDKNKGGRPTFEANAKDREAVKLMAGHNIGQSSVVAGCRRVQAGNRTGIAGAVVGHVRRDAPKGSSVIDIDRVAGGVRLAGIGVQAHVLENRRATRQREIHAKRC